MLLKLSFEHLLERILVLTLTEEDSLAFMYDKAELFTCAQNE